MGSSPAMVYTTAKASMVAHFKHGCQHDMIANMATLLLRDFFIDQVSRATSRELQLEALIIYLLFSPSRSSHKPMPQITLSRVEIIEGPMHFFIVV